MSPSLSITRRWRAVRYALPMLLLNPALAVEPTRHDHHAAAAELASVNAERWASDAALREGMRRLRLAIEDLDSASAQPAASAAAIEAAVNYLFAECRLPPAPDAALHGLLAQTLGAAAELRGAAPHQHARSQLQTVLQRYPQLFDDPAWTTSEADGQHADHHDK